MMKSVALCGVLLLLALSFALMASEEPPAEVPFRPGEKLTFDIRYGFVKAGVATMEIMDVEACDDGDCYRILSTARSTMPFSLFYEAHDSVFSLMDTRRLYTTRFEKHVKEGNLIKDEVVIFDQERHTATYPDSSVIDVPPNVQDVLSSLYFLRTKRLQVGQTVRIENHADRKNYPLEIKILRSETVSVPAGKFKCFVVEPILKASGLFEHQGSLTVWITQDARVMPVMMKGRVIVGSIDAVLTSVEPGR
jgi:hypothetical protein